MKKKASELEFISQILRDGSGVKILSEATSNEMQKSFDEFEICSLSMSEKTFIAFNMNAFVVRFKEKKILPLYKITPLRAKKLDDEEFMKWFNYQIEIAKDENN